MIKVPFLEIEQPIGTFYITKFNAAILSKIVEITPRSSDDKAIQRDESKSRIAEIAQYCSDPDATFPTPIIISVFDNIVIRVENNHFIIENDIKIGEVIDGQHRLKGIIQSNLTNNFELPVVLMFNLIEEEKAYVFSIINSKQTRVSMSLIYDLFSLAKERSPQKTAHGIARSLNKAHDSAFYNRLKMLGKKNESQEMATLSQGTFVKYLLTLISKNPDEDFRRLKKGEHLLANSNMPLREYFIEKQDEIILKILKNMFSALRHVFDNEWNNPNNNILWKTTGYGAIIRAFKSMYQLGDENNYLTEEHFKKCFYAFRDLLDERRLKLTSDFFPSNAQQQTRLGQLLIESLPLAYHRSSDNT